MSACHTFRQVRCWCVMWTGAQPDAAPQSCMRTASDSKSAKQVSASVLLLQWNPAPEHTLLQPAEQPHALTAHHQLVTPARSEGEEGEETAEVRSSVYRIQVTRDRTRCHWKPGALTEEGEASLCILASGLFGGTFMRMAMRCRRWRRRWREGVQKYPGVLHRAAWLVLLRLLGAAPSPTADCVLSLYCTAKKCFLDEYWRTSLKGKLFQGLL